MIWLIGVCLVLLVVVLVLMITALQLISVLIERVMKVEIAISHPTVNQDSASKR